MVVALGETPPSVRTINKRSNRVRGARERQRDKQLGITARRLSGPTIVLAGGVDLSLAANLAQAQPTAWGQVVAAVPSGAFLVAVSMIERRAAAEHQEQHGQPITRDALRARLGVSNQAASELLRQLRASEGRPPGASRAA
jgi:hypothetical protein